MTIIRLSALSAALVAVAACTPSTPQATADVAAGNTSTPVPAATATDAAPADAFLAALASHCGQAFAGRIVVNEPASPEPDAFEGKALVMHVRGCDDPTRELRVPFHVGDDHSRTWVLTRTGTGLRLKHDHRHEDGSSDVQTMYGGESTTAGTAVRQEFPVDAESIALFGRTGADVSTTNTWAMEVEPGSRFLYELSRPGGRMFQVEFDLATPVAEPPAPWGTAD
ncbi:hypothetical protein H5368_12220 [Luteimonas sp. MC1782]|uniref:hypothetical protein n=1 Tax=Luteimonas sp. MC1782 TaxID=2760305 RepID=UPI001603B66F|nr:hypothetical protein [Luteimonas sp. MC1782]MBB1473798.1 hypothetical protein [Luteimonas sp. MC1782]